MDTMPSALDMAFRTAALLTGATKPAEAAVIHGIDACEDLSPTASPDRSCQICGSPPSELGGGSL